MCRQWTKIVAALFGLTCPVYAQVAPALGSVPATPSGDTSPSLGRSVTHPEALSGFWETSNGHGGAVGIHLFLFTSVPTEGWEKPSDAPQSWQSLELEVYEREGGKIGSRQGNGFSDSLMGGNVKFEGGHLELHFIPRIPTDPSIDVDLIQQPSDRWAGRLRRGSFDSNVILSRPSANIIAKANSIVGTWIGGLGVPLSCVHITQQAPNEFIGWTDSLPRPLGPPNGSIPRGLRPKTRFPFYGRPIGIHLESSGKIRFDPNEGNGICCSQAFVGKLTEDGKFIQGLQQGTESAQDASLKRVAGDSCIPPESATYDR
jgi:hypothetical protein